VKLGAEPKKLGILGVLFLVFAYFAYSNWIAPTPDIPVQAARRQAQAASVRRTARPEAETQMAEAAEPAAPPARSTRGGAERTRPQFRMGSKERHADPATVDPTLRMDLLAHLQAVTLQGGDRNLFQFGSAPLPKTPEPKVVVLAKPAPMPPPAPPGPPPLPPKPVAPPCPLKFYGYSSDRASGPRRAFFLDGDEIIVAVEGQTMKSRYKVVRIGINSVVVQDVQFQSEQTLPLEEPAA
jgi:hypothetical protein